MISFNPHDNLTLNIKFLKHALAMLPRLALNLWSSHFGLLSNWHYKLSWLYLAFITINKKQKLPFYIWAIMSGRAAVRSICYFSKWSKKSLLTSIAHQVDFLPDSHVTSHSIIYSPIYYSVLKQTAIAKYCQAENAINHWKHFTKPENEKQNAKIQEWIQGW